MSETMYHLPGSSFVLSHFPALQKLVRDAFDDTDEAIRIQARIRSGDYAMTVATELDKLAQSIAAGGGPEAAELERLVSELLYVHKHFKLVRRPE